jgi:hypothetical protein
LRGGVVKRQRDDNIVEDIIEQVLMLDGRNACLLSLQEFHVVKDAVLNRAPDFEEVHVLLDRIMHAIESPGILIDNRELVSGPYLIERMEHPDAGRDPDRDGKIFYLVSEKHGAEMACHLIPGYTSTDIIDYYYELLIKSPEYIDFYIEGVPMFDSSTGRDTMFLSELRAQMNECMTASTHALPARDRPPECQLSRIHWTDIRNFDELASLVPKRAVKFLSDWFENVGYKTVTLLYENEQIPESYGRETMDMIKGFEGDPKHGIPGSKDLGIYPEYIDGRECVSFMKLIEFMFDMPLVKRQKEKMKQPRTHIDIVLSIANELATRYDGYLPRGNKGMGVPVEDLAVVFFIVASALMDVYTMTRIFKEYDMKNKHDYLQRAGKNSRFVVIHAGGAHIKNCKAALVRLGYKGVHKSNQAHHNGEKYDRCVNMIGSTQPWFFPQNNSVTVDRQESILDEIGYTPSYRPITYRNRTFSPPMMSSEELPEVYIQGESPGNYSQGESPGNYSQGESPGDYSPEMSYSPGEYSPGIPSDKSADSR